MHVWRRQINEMMSQQDINFRAKLEIWCTELYTPANKAKGIRDASDVRTLLLLVFCVLKASCCLRIMLSVTSSVHDNHHEVIWSAPVTRTSQQRTSTIAHTMRSSLACNVNNLVVVTEPHGKWLLQIKKWIFSVAKDGGYELDTPKTPSGDRRAC